MVALTEVLPAPRYPSPQFPLLTILSIAAFGVMGFRLPTGKSISKVLYTGLEFGLILLPIVLNDRGIRFFPLLCLVVVIRSCLIFKPQVRLIVAGLAFISFLFTLFLRVQNINFPARSMVQEQLRFTVLNLKLNAALLFGLTLAFVLLLINALLAERQSREKLAIANEQLQQYALRIEDQATLQERNRIARDIHDSLGHSLTALNLQLETALKLLPSNQAKAQTFLAQAKQLGSKALQQVRQSVSAMQSDPLQGRSLEAAIASLAEDFHCSTGVSPACRLKLGRPIPADLTTAIYRIVQEALTNISKHACATEVKIQLSATTTDLRLTIQDNGRGFKLDQNTSGFGLQSMRERTHALGGQFAIDSAPYSGCRIIANIPLPRPLQ
jgi:signal transduction histidine kinase